MTGTGLHIDARWIDSGDGWSLPLRRTLCPRRFDPDKRPVLILPGYGMTDFLFGHHPSGRSMERVLAEAGFEVWTGCFRRQGTSRRRRLRARPPGMGAFAGTDLPALVAAVRSATRTRAFDVELVGASLGGSILYGYLALHPHAPVANVVTVGAPLRWERVHPVVRALFSSRRIAGAVPLVGIPQLARALFPLASRVRPAMSIYMNVDRVDRACFPSLMQSVDAPHRRLNRDIACWLRDRDLRLGDTDVTAALAEVDRPLLVVLANRDGIVPGETARSVVSAWGGDDVTLVEVGDDRDWYAHADFFVAPDAPERVYQPMATWLASRQASADAA